MHDVLGLCQTEVFRPPKTEPQGKRPLMSNGVVSDLSSEMPSDRVPPGRHYFEGSLRMPVVGWRFMLTAKAPDRSPAAVATGVLALAVVSLTWPAILAIAASRVSLPTWTPLAGAAAAAVTMSCLTRFALWYQHGRARVLDLTKGEKDPTARADILIHRQDDDQQHRFEAGRGKATWTTVTWHSSSRSLPGLGMAFLILAAAALVPAAAIIWVAALIHAPAAISVISAMAAAAVCGACGTITMIRIEQIERESSRQSPQSDELALAPDPAPGRPRCAIELVVRQPQSNARRLKILLGSTLSSQLAHAVGKCQDQVPYSCANGI